MKIIEIDTAQKVQIQYELAGFGNRAAAFLVDLMIIWGAFFLTMVFALISLGEHTYGYAFYLMVVVPLLLSYTLISEILFNGQTIGKRLIGIKVVKLNGDAPTSQDFFMRWVFRPLDIWLSFGVLALVLIKYSERSQRLGCLLSNTAVIRLNQSRSFNLNEILKISSTKDYQPRYPQVVQFREEDMLFIKRVLERAKTYPNAAHQQAVKQLSQRVAEQLEVFKLEQKPSDFLRTLIMDYVVLTR